MARSHPLFSEDMWSRIVNVSWGYILHVEIYGGEGGGGYHLRVEEEGGPTAWQAPVFDPESAPEPGLAVGTTIDHRYLKPYRFLSTSLKSEEVQVPGSGAIVSWAQAFPYYDDTGPEPPNQTGSVAGVWDRCLDAAHGLYVGDPMCEALEIGGAVPAGGVARHLYIQGLLLEYGDISNPYKRIYYSHQGSPDQRFYFVDDRMAWTPESGITEAAWNAALAQPYDRSFFKAERAILDGGSVEFRETAAWLVNFSFRPPTPPGTPKKPVVVAIDVEEPGEGAADIDTSYVRLRRWGSPRFRIDNATGAEGQVTTYLGKRSPRIDQRRGPITWGPDGVVARFNKDGFIDP